MRKNTVAAILTVVLVLGASAAFAQGWDDTSGLWLPERIVNVPTQGWFGSTGMMVIPTATVVDHTRVSAHAHYIDLGGTDGWEHVYGINAALYPGLEAGLTWLGSGLTGTGSTETVVHAKYAVDMQNLLNLGPEAPQLAVGGRDLGNNINRTYYLALSKQFLVEHDREMQVGVTIGYGNSDVSGAPLDGFFIGLDLSPFDFARLQLEHDSENFNAQLRYWWSEWAVTEVGFLDGDFGVGASVYTGF